MPPIGGILLLVRLAMRATNTGTTAQAPATSRGTYTFMGDGGTMGTVLIQVLLTPTWFTFGALAMSERNPIFAAIAFACWVIVFPWWSARKIFMRLGLPKLAYFTARLSRVVWRADKPGGPALIAAWTLARMRTPPEKTIEWVEAKLSGLEALQASTVAAHAFLAAARGQLDEARRLFESVVHFDEKIATSTVRSIVTGWLVADAAANGKWAKVLEIAMSKKTPFSRTMKLFEALARRELGRPISTFNLWFYWFIAPRRFRTFRFVAQVAQRPEARVSSTKPIKTFPGAPLEAALYRQCALDAPKPADVVNVAKAWERALAAQSLKATVESRSLALGALIDADQVLFELRGLVEAELTPLIPTEFSDVQALGELPALMSQAFDARRAELTQEVEDRMDRLDARKQDNRELPAAEEWREVMALIRSYKSLAAMGGLSERSLAFSIIRDKFVNFAVWQFNQRHQKPLANAIFRFLNSEAMLLGDDESAELNRKNMACGL